MSINFSDDNRAEPREERYRGDEETLLSTNLLPDDDGEGSLRPRTLAEYIGQEKVKRNLSVFIEGAKRRNEPGQDHPGGHHRKRNGRHPPQDLWPCH